MSKTFLAIQEDQLAAFIELPIEGAFAMYNLLKYKTKVASTNQTGEEAYKDYMKAAYPFFQKANAEIVFKGKPEFVLIGDSNTSYWDEILIIKYASKKDFLGMVTAKGYPTKLRALALEDSRLILCR